MKGIRNLVRRILKKVSGSESSAPKHQSCQQSIKDYWLSVLTDYQQTNGSALDYVKCHLDRYLTTLEFIKAKTGDHILELGGSYPHAFTVMLEHTFPQVKLAITSYDEGSDQRKVTLNNQKTGKSFDVPSLSFNVEKDRWPLPTESVDIVLCMEIIEHLLLDPCHMFREAHRVLKPNGRLIVTTPNIASLESLYRIYHLKTPYSFGIYSKHGAYGRHNREYVPEEIEQIGQSCGFITDVLTTRNVYPKSCSTEDVDLLFNKPLSNFDLRRQNIFYVGVKTENEFEDYPESLYDYNPHKHRASVEIVEAIRDYTNSTISGTIKLTNFGSYTWMPDGNDITQVGVQRIDDDGKLIERDYRRISLNSELPPSDCICVKFSFKIESTEFDAINLRFDLVHEYVCWFSEIKPIYVDLSFPPINIEG